MLVLIRWQDRTMAVPLSQLEGFSAWPKTQSDLAFGKVRFPVTRFREFLQGGAE